MGPDAQEVKRFTSAMVLMSPPELNLISSKAI